MNKKLMSICGTAKGYLEDRWWTICIDNVWYIGDPAASIGFWKANGDYSDEYLNSTDDTYQVFDLALLVAHYE